MNDRNPAIAVSRLAKKLGGRVVFAGIGFEIVRREIVALTGSNGAGKTTLLRCLASAIRPDAGDIRWLNDSQCRGRRLRRQIGFATHATFLYPQLTAMENLLFAARMQGIAAPMRHVRQQLESVGLWRVRNLAAGRLSQGMGRRVSILRALIHAPPIVLFDEPFSGIDQDGHRWLCELILNLKTSGCAICFATHDQSLVQCLADRNLHLASGRLSERRPGNLRHAPPGTDTRQVA